MSEGSDSAPSLMALLFSTKAFAEYRGNLVSDFDLVASSFGEQSFYCCFGVYGLRLIKSITPLRVSLVRKRVQPSESKCATLRSTLNARL
jgi:heme/copper-type cytochrome/quinol oxidase subunit 3